MIKGIQFIIFFLVMSSFAKQRNIDTKVISLLSGEKNILSEIKKLDATHANLLNPNESNENIKVVFNSWTKIHQELQKYLDDNNFSWDVNVKTVKLFNRFYFDKSGRIKIYAFRVFNKVSKETETKFISLMENFVKTHTISIVRDKDFAQCGKIALPNTKKL